MSLAKVAPPSERQTLALSKLLDAVFLEHGLCPVKDLPTRQKVAEDVGKAVCTMFPGAVTFSLASLGIVNLSEYDLPHTGIQEFGYTLVQFLSEMVFRSRGNYFLQG